VAWASSVACNAAYFLHLHTTTYNMVLRSGAFYLRQRFLFAHRAGASLCLSFSATLPAAAVSLGL
jgi:hypothetical protein